MLREQEEDDATTPGGRLIVLTLRRHQDGIWITKLVDRLKHTMPAHVHAPSRQPEIEILALEDWLAEGWLVSHSAHPARRGPVLGIVNRVSDAAPPALFKACCALLAAAEASLRVPVWNGSAAYGLCGNKWRHHLLFRQAGLSAPKTMVYYAGRGEGATVDVDPRLFGRSASGATEVLLKPNAGGFGAGIQKISLPSRSAAEVKASPTVKIPIPSSFEDGMALVQQYEAPRNGKIYRVWFLRGKVQCAAVRTVDIARGCAAKRGDGGAASSAEFTSGCAGGNSCTLSGDSNDQSRTGGSDSDRPSSLLSLPAPDTRPPRPWMVPEEVRREIEDRLLPLLADAHCGSVEFMYLSRGVSPAPSSVSSASSVLEGDVADGTSPSATAVGTESRRLYFDLNLLSTLPLADAANGDATSETESAASVVSRRGADPWLELALGIWEFVAANHEGTKVE